MEFLSEGLQTQKCVTRLRSITPEEYLLYKSVSTKRCHFVTNIRKVAA